MSFGSKGDGSGVRRIVPGAALAVATLLSTSLPTRATTAPHVETLRARYSVTLLGIQIGDLDAVGAFQAQTYSMNLRAHLTGLATMISNTQMALASSGTLGKSSTVLPSTYATSAVNSTETRTLRMALTKGSVKAVEIVPEPEWRPERVPVTEANKRNILDPTSALIMPVPVKETLVGPAACERTLPIYDGYARFDISLHYTGLKEVQMAGYSGPVAVCSARYHPISGHLANSRSTAFMAQNDGIQLWLAPIEGSHLLVPIRVTMPTMAGELDIAATDFEIQGSAPGDSGGPAPAETARAK